MVDRFYGYQYDTNPKKLNLDTLQFKNKYPEKKERKEDIDVNSKISRNTYGKNKKIEEKKVDIKNESNYKERKTVNKEKSKNVKSKTKFVFLVFAVFSVLFMVGYQNSLISESFNKKEKNKKKYEDINKTNQQIEIGIENSLNLNNIEQVAKEKLGMQKLNNEQKIYVNLPKEDYIAPATEEVIINESNNFFDKLVSGFLGK